MRRRPFSLLLLLLLLAPVGATAVTDSARVLSRDAFIAIVRAYHPLVRSAALQVERARAGILQARGAFDPTVDAAFSNKTLDGKQYYQYFNPQVTIPTWYGLELIGGAEEVWGSRVNPEATLGQISYAGAKLNLNGIWLDSRRAALQQARILRDQSEAEQRLAVNNLLYDAISDYYSWQLEWQTLGILNEALANARERYRFTRTEWLGGARPAIDTIEALTQLQALELQQSSAALSYANATLKLSDYLWLASGQPLLPDNTLQPAGIPEADKLPVLADLLMASADHPKLAALRGKRDFLGVDRRLKSYLPAAKAQHQRDCAAARVQHAPGRCGRAGRQQQQGCRGSAHTVVPAGSARGLQGGRT